MPAEKQPKPDPKKVPTLEVFKQELARRVYADYVKYVHEGRWFPGKHLVYICNTIQDFLEGKLDKQILIIQVPPQHGKAIQDDVPVLTTKGFKRHGDLEIGDTVYNQNGEQVKILATQQSYLHDCMKLTLDTGESFICAKEHEWIIEADRGKKINNSQRLRQTEILETQHIFDRYHAKSPAIKVTKPLQNENIELPIEPYLLGLWLGDGSSRDISITSHNGDYEEAVQILEGKGHVVRVGNDSSNNKLIRVGTTNGKKNSNVFRNGIKDNNLFRNKHIPEIYFTSSRHQRLELLKGLMDSDGYVNKNGTICEYCGVNEKLVRDVFILIRSLGIKCSFRTGDATLNGKFISKKFRVQFTPNKGQEIFSLKRKQERINNKSKGDRNDKFLFFIKSVEECGQHSVKCITVEGGIYLVGEGLIPTHNSMSVTETLPSWYLGKYPTKRTIEASYGDDLAQRFGRRNKEKIERFGKKLFGIEINKKTSAATEFELSNGVGGMISRGIMAGITGQPADLIVIDDPIKNRQEADSETYRERLWDEFLNSILTRLSADGKIILIQTRWHEDDLAGRVIKHLPDKTYVINLPCEAEEDDPLGREVGDALFPEIGKDNAWLESFKQSYQTSEGKRAWLALFQGRPTAQEGNMLKRTWWQYYDKMPTRFDRVVQSWDCTFKDSDGSDFVVGQVWGMVGIDCYLLDQSRARMDLPTTIDAILNMRQKWPEAKRIFIEDKANGPAVIQLLGKKVSGLIAVNPEGGKIARASAVSPHIESGHVYLPNTSLASWITDFVEECSAFPNGAHDDMVDAMSQGINRLMYYREHEEKHVLTGTYAYGELKMMGYNDFQIRRLRNQIKIIGGKK